MNLCCDSQVHKFACSRSMKINGRSTQSGSLTGAKRMWRHCDNSRRSLWPVEPLKPCQKPCPCLYRQSCVTISLLLRRKLWMYRLKASSSCELSPFRSFLSETACFSFCFLLLIVFSSPSFYETWRVYPVSIICSVGRSFVIVEREYQSRRFLSALSLLSERSLQPYLLQNNVVSCFPLHFFNALLLPACFTTEQSTVKASLFGKWTLSDHSTFWSWISTGPTQSLTWWKCAMTSEPGLHSTETRSNK